MTGSVHSMADCLLDWFRALQSPLIPEKCTSRIEKGEKINSAFVDAFMNMVGVREGREERCLRSERMCLCI